MSRVVAYARVSTNKQDLANQRHEIERYCSARGFLVDAWDSEIISGTIKVKDRRIGTLLDQLERGDTLIVAEVSRISRSLRTILDTIEDAIERGITVVSVKENFIFGDDLNSRIIATAFGLAAQIERSLISARTREALARKRSEGMRLGRPPGKRPDQRKLHGKDREIMKLMDKRVSIAAIARLLDVNRQTVSTYIEQQDLRRRLLLERLTKTDV